MTSRTQRFFDTQVEAKEEAKPAEVCLLVSLLYIESPDSFVIAAHRKPLLLLPPRLSPPKMLPPSPLLRLLLLRRPSP